MRVLLARNLFADSTRYRVHSGGTEIPDHLDLPPGAKIWDGEKFVVAPAGQKEREALVKKSSKAVEEEEEKAAKAPPKVPLAMYDPRYKSPNSPEPIQGSAASLTPEEQKIEAERAKREQARDDVEEKTPSAKEGERWQGKSKDVEYPPPENKTKK